jgi:hypothetical protein
MHRGSWAETGQRKVNEGFGKTDDKGILLVLLDHLRIFWIYLSHVLGSSPNLYAYNICKDDLIHL